MNITNKEVEMIAYFKAGEIKPLRFRIRTDNGIQVVKIKSSVLKINNSIYLAYNCEIVLNNIRHECEIRYIISDMKWIIYEMR